jgi:hypothetical protein
MYLLIAIFLVFLFLRVSTSDNQVGGGTSFSKISPLLFSVLGFIIILNAYLKN